MFSEEPHWHWTRSGCQSRTAKPYSWPPILVLFGGDTAKERLISTNSAPIPPTKHFLKKILLKQHSRQPNKLIVVHSDKPKQTTKPGNKHAMGGDFKNNYINSTQALDHPAETKHKNKARTPTTGSQPPRGANNQTNNQTNQTTKPPNNQPTKQAKHASQPASQAASQPATQPASQPTQATKPQKPSNHNKPQKPTNNRKRLPPKKPDLGRLSFFFLPELQPWARRRHRGTAPQRVG